MLTFDTVIQTQFGSYFKAFCLPSDTKPTTGVCSGSTVEEFNPVTGKVDIYRFNGTAWEKTVSDGTPANSVPEVEEGDTGKVLTVGADGPAWASLPLCGVLKVGWDVDEEEGTATLDKTWQEIVDAGFAVLPIEEEGGPTDIYTLDSFEEAGEEDFEVTFAYGEESITFIAEAADEYPVYTTPVDSEEEPPADGEGD